MTVMNEQMPDEDTIFSWAQVYRERKGEYPDAFSGRVSSVVEDADKSLSWAAIDRHLGGTADEVRSGGERVLTGLAGLLEAYHRMHTPLTEAKIIRWAGRHRRKNGAFPTVVSGIIDHSEAKPDTWQNINSALFLGLRGLDGGRTLAEFLDEHEKKTSTLSEDLILGWLDAHFERHGEYPTRATPGEIPGSSNESWHSIDVALNKGLKGLPKRRPSDRLVDFILRNRPSRRPVAPRFSLIAIVAWAKAYFTKYGVPPSASPEVIEEPAARGATWAQIDDALLLGKGGLPGGVTLERFLDSVKSEFESDHVERGESVGVLEAPAGAMSMVAEHANVEGGAGLAVAVLDHEGDSASGDSAREDESSVVEVGVDRDASESPVPVAASVEDGSEAVPVDANVGVRSGAYSEAAVMRPARSPKGAKKGGGPRKPARIRFTPQDLFKWIGEYRAINGRLPDARARGKIAGAPAGVTWPVVDATLKSGWADYPVGLTLREYASKHRFDCVEITSIMISTWALSAYASTGQWPRQSEGDLVPCEYHMQWSELAKYWAERVRIGAETRTVEQIISDTKLVKERADKAARAAEAAREVAVTDFKVESVMALVEAFEHRHGRIPKPSDGIIPGTGGITWAGVNNLLKHNMVGLHHASTLRDFVDEQRGAHKLVREDESKSKVSIENIRAWISAHVEETGSYPRLTSGRIDHAKTNWRQVSAWLGEHGHTSLAKFLYDEFGVIGDSVVNPAARFAQRGLTRRQA